MRRFEVAIEVEPTDDRTVSRLEADGYSVSKGASTWRVRTTVPVLADGVVAAQALALALSVVDDYSLVAVSDPPSFVLSDPDAGLDDRPDLVLREAREAEDRAPAPRPRRKWYQRVMELGLGERKGD